MPTFVAFNFDQATVSDLVPEVWPIVQEVRQQQRQEVLRAIVTL